MKIIERNKALFKSVLLIALPIMVQNGFTNFVSLLDNIMVGRLGTEPMSGVAIVNQILFVYNLCIFGATSGAGIFTSQFVGKADVEGIRNTFRFKLLLGMALTLAAVLIIVLSGSNLIMFFLNDANDGGDLSLALSNAETYMRIMLLGLPAFCVVQSYSSTLRECGQTLVPMKAGVAAVLVNLVFNYLLIYGKLGFPQLGVSGAAIATVLSRYVEALIVVLWTHRHTDQQPFAKGLYRTLLVPRTLVSRITRKGLILLVNETLWAVGLTLVSQCYSMRGLNAVAGVNIANTLNNLFKVVFLAFGSSVGIIIGQMLGAGEMEKAKETDRKIIMFSVFVSSIVGLLMVSLAWIFPKLYNTSDAARAIATSLIVVQGICLPMDAYKNATYFTLRSGGRTFITFMFDGFSVIALNYPIAYFLSRFTSLGVLWIFICVQFGSLVHCIVGTILVHKGVWLRNIVSE